MRIEPAPRGSPCVALLDDMGEGPGARSRLYVGHAGTLSLHEPAALPAFLEHMQLALSSGYHALGLFTYELGKSLHSIPVRARAHTLAQVLLFEHCRRIDKSQVAAWLQGQSDSDASGVANLRASVTEEEFNRAIARVQDYIAAGDTYQVNYTFRLDFDVYGPPAALYSRLRQRQKVPYGALVMLPDGGAVLSLSPELFVRHRDGGLIAKPMKGTSRATVDDVANQREAQRLAADAKNRAENVMIVDLLRNDLSRVAKTGSVRVPALFDVDRFGEVLQMTSTVTAQLKEDCTLTDIFRAVFPCGSVTGAPKRRSMQIIDELESRPRGLYTGGIGWFDAASQPRRIGDFCLSVPIRTLALQALRRGVRKAELGIGAGIVADSVARDEFDECRLKARFLTGLASDFELIETLYATHDEGCRHLRRHLERLAESARYFGFALNAPKLAAALGNISKELAPAIPYRVRLALHHDGRWSLQKSCLALLVGPVHLFIAEERIDADDLFLRHKTSVRGPLDAAWRDAERRGGFDMLFFNRRGELAQGARSNVFLKISGRWYTPPVASGALPGVMRSAVLDDSRWQARERVLRREDLDNCDEVMVCNALRSPLVARLCEEPLLVGDANHGRR